MPELPEVEIVKRGLERALLGKRIVAVRLKRHDLRRPFPDGFASRLQGSKIERVTRRAKYILAHLDSGEILLVHLGMSGRFTIVRAGQDAAVLGEFYDETVSRTSGNGPHDHVVLEAEGGVKAVYTDPRRFGIMDLIPEALAEGHPLLAKIGIEPLGNELSGPYLVEVLRGKKAPLKAALMDQRIIAGLGNIYVCEALHRARLSPLRRAGSLVKAKAYDPRLDDLVHHIRAVLREAIEAGGSTLRDHARPEGGPGAFQSRFLVYDREGGACFTPGCVGTIKRIVQAGRSTFYCRQCQK